MGLDSLLCGPPDMWDSLWDGSEYLSWGEGDGEYPRLRYPFDRFVGEALILTPGGSWSLDVNPRTFRDSAALIRLVSCGSGTLVSPLYMKSRMHCISQHLTSFSTMMGCLPGLSVKIF